MTGGNGWLTTNEAGSGPFKLDVWEAKDVLRVNCADVYWRCDAKMRLRFGHMTESQALRLMIKKGDIDVATGMSVLDINALKANPDVKVGEVKKGTLYYVAISLKNDEFTKPKVREAVRYLIDYDGINKTVMLGYGFYHQRPIQAGMDATLPNPGYKLAVPKAKALLDKDLARQKQLYAEIQDRYEALYPAIIPVSQMVDSVVQRKDVVDFI